MACPVATAAAPLLPNLVSRWWPSVVLLLSRFCCSRGSFSCCCSSSSFELVRASVFFVWPHHVPLLLKLACLHEQVVPEVKRIASLLQEHAAVLELPPIEWYEETFKQDDARMNNTTTVRL